MAGVGINSRVLSRLSFSVFQVHIKRHNSWYAMFARKVVHTAQNMFMVQLATSLAVLALSSSGQGNKLQGNVAYRVHTNSFE
jgi:hypothetical protein